MNETEGLNQLQSYEERWKELKKRKRKNLDTMKRLKRGVVKSKLEKKRINREVKQLQKEWQELCKTDPAKAKATFAEELRNVSTDDMFPKDLEKEFDKIELKNIKNGRTMRTEDLSDDKDMRGAPKNAAEVLERELEEELKDHDEPTPINQEAEEPDEATKLQLEAETIAQGLTEGDVFIDEDGNEEELTPHDENHGV